jgi:molybdopterin converting factor subunit 1
VRVNVRFFAGAREAAGRDAESLDAPDGATVSDVRRLLAERHPGLAPVLGRARLAVGERFVPPGTALRDGDTVAVIPPVSGG